jgi:hypothetical protein
MFSLLLGKRVLVASCLPQSIFFKSELLNCLVWRFSLVTEWPLRAGIQVQKSRIKIMFANSCAGFQGLGS